MSPSRSENEAEQKQGPRSEYTMSETDSVDTPDVQLPGDAERLTRGQVAQALKAEEMVITFLNQQRRQRTIIQPKKTVMHIRQWRRYITHLVRKEKTCAEYSSYLDKSRKERRKGHSMIDIYGRTYECSGPYLAWM